MMTVLTMTEVFNSHHVFNNDFQLPENRIAGLHSSLLINFPTTFKTFKGQAFQIYFQSNPLSHI